MAEKKASQIVNEACLVDCEEGGNVNVTIHGNLTIIAGGDSNVADTEMGKTVAGAHGSKDEIRQSQESVDMQSDSRAEGRVRSDKSGPQTKVYKRRVFRQQIRSRCEKEDGAVSLLAAIYESNNDDLIQSLPGLPNVRFTSLGPDEAHMFSSILARRADEKKEEKVDFSSCELNDELLDIMVQNLKDRKIRVGYLDLSFNWRLTAKGLKPFLAIFKADEIWIDKNLLKYFRYEDFEWNNITTIEWGLHCGLFGISMTNKGERIEIEGEVNGYFDKTTRALETVR